MSECTCDPFALELARAVQLEGDHLPTCATQEQTINPTTPIALNNAEALSRIALGTN